MFVNFNVNFTGNRVIDAHVHTGHWYKEGCDGPNYCHDTDSFKHLKTPFLSNPLSEDVFVKSEIPDYNTVEHAVISGLDVMSDYYTDEFNDNKALLNSLENDSFYVPLIVCRPDKTDGDSSEVQRLLDELPGEFSGFKFHPDAMNLIASDSRYDSYMEIAEENNLPCVFHSEGDGVSGVRAIYDLAKRFPNTPVVMAHMGAGGIDCHNKAIDVFEESLKNNDANLYVDLSWVDWDNGLPSVEKPSVKRVIDTAIKYDALDRILFGTDTPLGCFGERCEGGLDPHQAYGKAIDTLKVYIEKNYPKNHEEIVDKILYENAANLFNID